MGKSVTDFEEMSHRLWGKSARANSGFISFQSLSEEGLFSERQGSQTVFSQLKDGEGPMLKGPDGNRSSSEDIEMSLILFLDQRPCPLWEAFGSCGCLSCCDCLDFCFVECDGGPFLRKQTLPFQGSRPETISSAVWSRPI